MVPDGHFKTQSRICLVEANLGEKASNELNPTFVECLISSEMKSLSYWMLNGCA